MLLTALYAKILKIIFFFRYHKDTYPKIQPFRANLFEKQKRPWQQTKDRRFLVRFVWQSRSPGFSSAFPDYFRWLFPTVKNLSVIWSRVRLVYAIILTHFFSHYKEVCHYKNPTNRNSCWKNRNKPRNLLPKRDIFVPFGFATVGKHCTLSKA